MQSCKHNTRSDVYVEITCDEDALYDGWDGDEPLDPEREWTAYQLLVMRGCTECDAADDVIDSLGAVWASTDAVGTESVLERAADLVPAWVGEDFHVVWRC